jgi:hypothetical protein
VGTEFSSSKFFQQLRKPCDELDIGGFMDLRYLSQPWLLAVRTITKHFCGARKWRQISYAAMLAFIFNASDVRKIDERSIFSRHAFLPDRVLLFSVRDLQM